MGTSVDTGSIKGNGVTRKAGAPDEDQPTRWNSTRTAIVELLLRGYPEYHALYRMPNSSDTRMIASGVVHTINDCKRRGGYRLAVDGLALVYHVMTNDHTNRLHLSLGCDYLTLARLLLEYLSALTKAGIVPLVIMDGMHDQAKMKTTLERRRVQAERASACFNLMRSVGSKMTTDNDEVPDDFTTSCLGLLPLFAAETLAASCQAAGVPYRVADREADPELAAACLPRESPPPPSPLPSPPLEEVPTYAPEDTRVCSKPASPTVCVGGGERNAHGASSGGCGNEDPFCRSRKSRSHGGCSADPHSGEIEVEVMDGTLREGCDAVLSNDSDFFVIDVPGYIPFSSLGVAEDGSAGAMVFRRSKLAARLGIPVDLLPDLACLIGNDWIQPGEHIHRAIMAPAAGNGTGSISGGRQKQRKGGPGARRSSLPSSVPAKNLVEATARFLIRHSGRRSTRQSMDRLRGGRSKSAGERPHLIDIANNHGQSTSETERGVTEQEETDYDEFLGAILFPPPVGSGDVGSIAVESGTPHENQEVHANGAARFEWTSSKRKGRARKKERRKCAKSRQGGSSSFPLPNPGKQAKAQEGEDAIEALRRKRKDFVECFKAAKLHYQSPGTDQSDLRRVEARREPEARSSWGLRSGANHGFISAVGLRSGFSATPELAQAILEGSFWCRVMLEDDLVSREGGREDSGTLSGSSCPRGESSQLAHPGDAACHHSDDRDQSAFGAFANVRRRLYQLGLALRKDPVPRALDVTTTGTNGGLDPATAESESESESESGSLGKLFGWDVPSSGQQARDASKRGEPKVVEGRSWIVTEFRRRGASVEPAEVTCQVPARTFELPWGAIGMRKHAEPTDFVRERWSLCLKVLGLEEQEHHLLTALVIDEWREFSGLEAARVMKTDTCRADRRGCLRVAGVALVASLFLTQSARHSVDRRGSKSACPKVFDCSLRHFVTAFVAASTRCVCSLTPPRWDGATKISKDEDALSAPTETAQKEGMLRSGEAVGPRTECRNHTDRGRRSSEGCGCDCMHHDREKKAGAFDRQRIGVDDVGAVGNGFVHVPFRCRAEQLSDICDARCSVTKEELGDCTTNMEEGADTGYGGKGTGGRDGEGADLDCVFVNLWTRIQAAAWHVNACNTILRWDKVASTVKGGCKAGGWTGPALDPLRLRPALALCLYKRLRVSSFSQGDMPYTAVGLPEEPDPSRRRVQGRGDHGNLAPHWLPVIGCTGGCAWSRRLQTALEAVAIPS